MARDPYGDHNHGLSLIKLLLLLLTHGVPYFRPGPLSADAAIDRFNIHSAEVSTLYPHYRTHGLALPFGWTNGVPTKPSYCHDTLLPTLTNAPLEFRPGGPMPTKGTNGHRRGKNINGPKQGQKGA